MRSERAEATYWAAVVLRDGSVRMCRHPAPGSNYPDPGNVDSGPQPQDGEHGSRGQQGSRGLPHFQRRRWVPCPGAGPFCEPSSHEAASMAVYSVDLTSGFICALGVWEGISIASWLNTWSSPRALFITVGLGQVNL